MTNCGFSSKSLGGYPVIDNSGKTTSSAPCALARAILSAILREFWTMSPTVGLIWANAMRMGGL